MEGMDKSDQAVFLSDAVDDGRITFEDYLEIIMQENLWITVSICFMGSI